MTKKKQVNLRLPEEVIQQLREEAEQQKRSLNNLLEIIIEEYLQNRNLVSIQRPPPKSHLTRNRWSLLRSDFVIYELYLDIFRAGAIINPDRKANLFFGESDASD